MPNCITGEAPQLKGDGTIKYRIARDERGLYLQITCHSGEGTWSKERVYLGELCHYIASIRGNFKRCHLREAIPNSNNNDLGFVVAILKHIRLVESAGGSGEYRFKAP